MTRYMFILMLWGVGSLASEVPSALLGASETEPMLSRMDAAPPESAFRHRVARVNQDLFSDRQLGARELSTKRFEVVLFDDDMWDLRVQSRDVRGPDRYTLTAVDPDRPHAYAILTYQDGVSSWDFHDPVRPVVSVRTLDADWVEVMEVDPASGGGCGGALVREPEPGEKPVSLGLGTFSTGTTTVDVAVVYTAAARNGAGGTSPMQAAIHTAINQGNLVFANSALDVVFRAVYVGEVDYAESGDMLSDLNRLTNTGDGFLEEVHCLRNHYGADLVQLVTQSGQYGGLAWIMCTVGPGFASSGFSVARRDSLTSYVLTHEFGHNFGCDHDHANVSDCRAHTYSHGHRFVNNDNLNKTVMAYDPGFTIGHFSNPDVSFFGTLTGTASNNNARTLRETVSLVANFRPTSTAVVPPIPTSVQAVAIQTHEVRVTWTGCGASGYVVRRDGVPVGSTTGLSFIDVGLSTGESYCWTVVATNESGASAPSGSACAVLPSVAPFVMDGVADHSTYLLSNPGMTIYAAVRHSNLYVATWSTGIYPGDTTKGDHFIFVTDTLLPSASSPAPWTKTGLVAMNTSTKPYLGAESDSDYIGWFNAPPSSSAAKAPLNSGQMEGVLNLVQAFGSMPSTVYIAVAAYQTENQGALTSQAPAGGAAPNISPSGFLAVNTLAIKDVNGDGVFDRLDPALDFVTHDIQSVPAGTTLTWASMPGEAYRVDYAVAPNASWLVATNLTATSGQVFLSWTDPSAASATSRVYRVVLP